MIKKKLLYILSILAFLLLLFSFSDVFGASLDENHFQLFFNNSDSMIFRNLPEDYYNKEIDYFFINKYTNSASDVFYYAFIIPRGKSTELGGYWFNTRYDREFLYNYDNGSSIVTNYCYLHFLRYEPNTDSWSFEGTTCRLDLNDTCVPSTYIYAPVEIYGNPQKTSVWRSKTGYVGDVPYVANTDAQLERLTVGELALNTFDVPASILTVSLYNDTINESLWSIPLMDYQEYYSRLDLEDPFSERGYVIPWQDLPEFDFIEGNQYTIYINYATNVQPSTRTFVASKTIHNIDIPLTHAPEEPTPTPTPDPNAGLIESNKETQNILNEQTNAIKEQTETNKNIFQKIGDILNLLNPFSEDFFAYKLLELLFEGLKSFILPSSEFLSDFFNKLSDWFQARLGFLWTPFDLVNQFLEKLDNNSLFGEPVIHIPNIDEPFTGQQIIQGNDFNLNSLLSNNTLQKMYDVYLMIVDFIIYIGVISLCYNTLVSVFRGSPSSISVTTSSTETPDNLIASENVTYITHDN